MDFEKQTDEQILERYKELFPDKDESKLLQNIKYQRLVAEATQRKKPKKSAANPTPKSHQIN